MIHDDLKNELKEAMRAKDEVKLRTIRGLLAAFTNELVAQKKKPDDVLDDKAVQDVVKRQVKQRKDSIEQFEKAGRNDLADPEKEELSLLKAYLPEQMNEDEVRKIVEDQIAKLGVTDKSGMGQLMGAIMKETAGAADGQIVKKIVDELL